jgi:hypothetical protein
MVTMAAVPAKRGRRPALPRPLSTSERASSVIGMLGGTRKVAEFLRVSPSQPSRWRSGQEEPAPENARALLDLDHVLARLRLLYTLDVAHAWLTGSNAHLGGARPIDVLVTRGASEVIDALDATMAGAFA